MSSCVLHRSLVKVSPKPRRSKRSSPRPRRYPEATVSTTMRLRQSVREHLEAWAKRGRRSVSEIAQELIEEGMRMRECPGIYFATEPSGRTAKIAGTLSTAKIISVASRNKSAIKSGVA